MEKAYIKVTTNGICIIDDIENAQIWIDEREFNEETILEVVKMSDKEISKLPDFDGF